MSFKKIGLFLAFLLGSEILWAQQPDQYLISRDYRRALDLYDHQSYSSAAILFKSVYTESNSPENKVIPLDKESLLKINARFYSVFCDLQLNQKKSENEALTLLKEYPKSPLVQLMQFNLGNFYFSQKDYLSAFSNLEKVNPELLLDDQSEELNFNLAYSYLNLNRLDEAENRFSKLLKHPGRYYQDALYYSGHISFLKKDYERALARFSSLDPKGKYADIYPLYVDEIYLMQGKYDMAISSGKARLAEKKTRHSGELNRLVGSAYFFKNNFPEAGHYFDRFKEDSASLKETTQNRYQIGFTDYKNGQYSKAIMELRPLLIQRDAYAQNGLYILGLCYLKQNQTSEAKNAFQISTTLPGEPSVTENALYYYIKLSYDLGLNQEALAASRTFVGHYPNSTNLSEIKTVEGQILINSRNYPEAYETLKTIPNRSPLSEAAFQKVCYFYGLEQYNLDHFKEALGYLQESEAHPQNKGIVLLGHFWLGETQYELGNYDQAIPEYQSYLTIGRTGSLRRDALYGEGYAYFKKANYSQSLNFFEKFMAEPGLDNQKKDASARLADCYFMLREYGKAKNLYTQNSNNLSGGADYSLFQSANILGLQNNGKAKIKTLQSLLSQYPKSTYADQAQYEIGAAYLSLGNSDQALEEFKKIQTNYPNSPLVPKSLLKIGSIKFNANQDDDALDQYKKVVSQFPGTEEARTALSAIKNIYMQKGDASGFLNYAGKAGNGMVTENARDSLTYQTAYQQFLKGNYQGSLSSFKLYLDKFPGGGFSLDAHANRASSFEKLGRGDEASGDYEFIVSQPRNQFSESSLLKLSSIYLKRKDYNRALPILKNLSESAQLGQNYAAGIEGQLIAYNGLNNPDSTLFFAQKLLDFTKSSPLQLEEAGLYGGKAFLTKGDTIQAESYLLGVVKNSRSVFGAEARYLTAEIQFKKANYKGSQKILFDLIKQLPAYNYWVAKSFLLLGDNYYAMGDKFQANSTYQSLIDHYNQEDDIKKSVRDRLSKLSSEK